MSNVPEGADVVEEVDVEEEVVEVEVVEEVDVEEEVVEVEVVEEVDVEEEVVEVEVVEEEATEEDVVKVVDEEVVDFGTTAKYAAAPATTIITITITAVTVLEMARDALPFKLLTYKVSDTTRCSII